MERVPRSRPDGSSGRGSSPHHAATVSQRCKVRRPTLSVCGARRSAGAACASSHARVSTHTTSHARRERTGKMMIPEAARTACMTGTFEASSAEAAAPMPSAAYQIALTGLLSLNFGLVLFDRNALSFLMPFVQPDLDLNNAQVGILVGALSLTWAAAALGIGALVDRYASRKRLLVLSTLAFSACSFGSGLATSFALLLATRLLMGAA